MQLAETTERQGGRKDRSKLANLAFKTAFVPLEDGQISLLEQGFGTARFAYNWGLAMWEERRRRSEKNSFETLRNALNAVKHQEFPWMAHVPKDIPAEAIRDLTVAYKNFFDACRGKGSKAKPPRRKKKGRSKFSFRLPSDRLRFRAARVGGTSVTEVYLSKIGWVRLREEFLPIGNIVYATVSRRANQYFVSFCMEYEPVKRLRRVSKPTSIGIDLGLTHTLTLSSGVKIEGPRSLGQHQKELAKADRKLHRRVKGSKNRAKAARRVACLHQRVANIRRDFSEKVTTNLLRRYDIIGMEDLNVAGLQKSRRNARSLMDASFGKILTLLQRKARAYGCLVVEIDRFYPSSKTCRRCQIKNQDLTLADRTFCCPSCGHREDRDIQAAKNIHHEALRNIPGATGKFTPVESAP